MYDKVLYRSKAVKGETAVKKIESGHRVVIGHGAAEPSYLVQKLADNRNYFVDVEIIQMLPGKKMPLIEPGMEKSFHSFLPVDVSLIHVSLPDSNGFCSFGAGVDYIKIAAENVALVIAQVNKNMPYVNGNSKIHIRDAKRKDALWDAVVKSNRFYEEIIQMIENPENEENMQ